MYNIRTVKLTRKENNTNAKKKDILRLLSAPARYIKCKVKGISKKLMKKEPKKTDKISNEVNNAFQLQNKSIDKLKKEDLINNLLKSEGSNVERNYMKHLNNNTNDNNINTNTNDDNDDDTYDSKIRDKISDIRNIVSRLRNAINQIDRKKIKKELYEIENKKKSLSDKEKEKIYDDLVELVRTLDKKEKYKYHDRDDLDYHEIRGIENYLMLILVMLIITNQY